MTDVLVHVEKERATRRKRQRVRQRERERETERERQTDRKSLWNLLAGEALKAVFLVTVPNPAHHLSVCEWIRLGLTHVKYTVCTN